MGAVVRWAGDWLELADSTSAPWVVAGLAPAFGYTPVIELQFFDGSSGRPLRPLDASTRSSYRASAVRFARRHRPPYLGLGTEINTRDRAGGGACRPGG
jgi:hypothetical protein